MSWYDLVRLQDDGCPNTPEHTPYPWYIRWEFETLTLTAKRLDGLVAITVVEGLPQWPSV